jgi:hypothetical protein
MQILFLCGKMGNSHNKITFINENFENYRYTITYFNDWGTAVSEEFMLKCEIKSYENHPIWLKALDANDKPYGEEIILRPDNDGVYYLNGDNIDIDE